MIDPAIALALALAGATRPDAAAASSPAPPLAFVYVESNVGGASGGHSALRIGEQTYHYQRAADGLLHLERDDWNRFRHVYAGLQNRSLHLAWVSAPTADVERIAAWFARAYVTDQVDLDRRRRLDEDASWWAALRDGAALPPLRGAGLLSATQRDDEAALALRDDVGAALGPRFLHDARIAVERELARVAPHGDSTDLETLREALLLREALCALEEGRPLAPEVVIADVDREPLSAAERESLQRSRSRLAATIRDLLGSRRPDRGFPLHVAIARHQAMSRSLACGHLVTLDDFPDAAPVAPGSPEEAAAAQRVAARATVVVQQAREAVLADRDFVEARFALFEEAIARAREAARGARGEPMRRCDGRLLPTRGRSVAMLPEGRIVSDAAARAQLAESRLRAFEATLQERCRYQLVERNCATELVRTLNDAFAAAGDGATAAALGGTLAPGESLTFIPFVLDEEVNARFRVERVETIASHRLQELRRLDGGDPGLVVRLRESTTLSSSIYTPRSADGAFLFFTDDTPLLRPLAGACNLGWGLAIGLGGLFAAPFDDAALLRSGIHGAFFSLPELLFCNVRKGTFRDLDPD